MIFGVNLIFLEGHNSINTLQIFLQIFTGVPLIDVNRCIKFEQNLRWVVLKSSNTDLYDIVFYALRICKRYMSCAPFSMPTC